MTSCLNFCSALLHADTDHGLHGFITEALRGLGRVGEFLDEVILHALLDTIKLLPFLFLTYLLMEFIEHKASEKAKGILQHAGPLGPIAGGLFGAVPQCGFSAAAANLYAARVISLGALASVFLSTSDEMLPILIAGDVSVNSVLLIVVYKMIVGIAVGVVIDLVLKIMKRPMESINIDEMCDSDNCHCEDGILHSAIHHSLHVSVFVLLVTLIINLLLFFIGSDKMSGTLFSIPVLSHILCSLFGLIPNCAASVALTRLAMSNIISSGAMISGLFSGAGVGLLILFKVNKRTKENIIITLILIGVGVAFGLIADLIPALSL